MSDASTGIWGWLQWTPKSSACAPQGGPPRGVIEQPRVRTAAVKALVDDADVCGTILDKGNHPESNRGT